MQISKLQVMGMRCSGTNAMHEVLSRNFADLEVTRKHNGTFKHACGHWEKHANLNDNTLYIVMVRHPISWAASLFRKVYEFSHLTKSWDDWLSLPWCGKDVHTDEPTDYDMHPKTHEPYKNIFEARLVKNKTMFVDLSQRVKYIMFVRQEDLLNDFETVFEKIAKKINIIQKTNNKYNILFRPEYIEPKNIVVPEKAMQQMKILFNWTWEQQIGAYTITNFLGEHVVK